MKKMVIQMNRSELLFLYDIADANPNGDPLDENRPRIDEETEINIVTDVRLKRTIRDYLHDFKNEEIFIIEEKTDDGHVQSLKDRLNQTVLKEDISFESLEDSKNFVKDNLLEKFIDARLFGLVVAPKNLKVKINDDATDFGSFNLTGPVQFRMGRSLNKVEIQHIKGTGAFASGDGKDQKTFREEYIVPYSLISFYGIINENTAEETNLSDDDIQLLLEGIWNGTKNLISRSKFGQSPRCLIQIEYNEDNFFIGDLNNKISIVHDLEDDKKLRKISEFDIDLSVLIASIEENKDKIAKINYKIDSDIKFKDLKIEDILSKFKDLNIETFEINF